MHIFLKWEIFTIYATDVKETEELDRVIQITRTCGSRLNDPVPSLIHALGPI